MYDGILQEMYDKLTEIDSPDEIMKTMLQELEDDDDNRNRQSNHSDIVCRQ